MCFFILNKTQKMSFNGSFGDAEFINDDESNNNNISFGQEEIKMNLACGTSTKKNSGVKVFINNESSIPSNSKYNNYFSIPMELEGETTYQHIDNDNNNINDLLSKELLKYNINNIISILTNKIAIIKTNIFYQMKNIYKNKLNTLLKVQILYLRISSSLKLFITIFNIHRINNLFFAFIKLKGKYNYYLDMKENGKNNFRTKFENNYKQKKNNIISQKNNDINTLQNDIKTLEDNIKDLNMKELQLKVEINNYLYKENILKEKIKSIESLNNSLKKSIQSSNSSSINTISKYDNEILSLENALNLSKNLKEEKEKLINKFISNVNNLLNEYQVYIDNLKSINTSKNNNNNMNVETSSSNMISIKHKETNESSLFGSKFSM